MGLTYIRRANTLDDALTLAPERWDPRRIVEEDGPKLGEFFQSITVRISPKNLPSTALVLDCGHEFEGTILFKGGQANPNKKSIKTELQPGDVIISRLRPYLRQVAFVDDALFIDECTQTSRAVVCSAEFCVIRSKPDIPTSPACIVPYLLSPRIQSILSAAQSGGHHPRITTELILSLPWPFSSNTQADEHAESVKAQVTAIRNGFRRLAAQEVAGEE